jgi:2,3-diketo-5-methylthio-1-phosphopentane phosphatase
MNNETIPAKVALSDLTGTISSVACSDREMEFFKIEGPYIIAKLYSGGALSKQSRSTQKELFMLPSIKSWFDVTAHIYDEAYKGNLIPDQMGLASEIIAYAYNTHQLAESVIFEDVLAAFKNWKDNGAGIYLFSNGSSDLQKAVLKNSERGDLTNLVDGYFDTMMVGSKKVPESFIKIQDLIKVDTNKIVFFSDSEKELIAADKAGCYARLVERPGNSVVANNSYGRLTDMSTVSVKNIWKDA